MPSSHRLHLAWLRLALLFVLGCFLALQTGLLMRATREHDQGRFGPQPVLPAFPYLGITFVPTGLAPDALDQELARLADLGFGWVRVRLAWEEIEPQPGQWQWDTADTLVGASTRAGLEPVLVLDGSPAWARAAYDQTGADAALAPPADFDDFARFAAAVATRYAPQMRVYQVWDEPNISPHWGTRHVEPVAYARLLKAAANALRAADPDAYILLAALAPTADRGHTAQDEVYFLQRLYAAGAAPYFDAVAIQPFGFGTHPQDTRQHRTVLNLRRAVLVRRAMVAAGDGNTPIWLVRYGWNRAHNSPWGTVTPQHQAAFAEAALAWAYQEWPWVAAQGWAAHAPALAADTPLSGFSLTPDLASTFQAWSRSAAQQPYRPVPQPAPRWPLAGQWGILAAVTAIWAWRVYAAARQVPWQALRDRYLTLPLPVQWALWAALGMVYWLAAWPPLIAVCWVVAALLIAAQPIWGPGWTLALLPFHAQHKELSLVDTIWAIPPAYAALACSLPGLWINRQTLRRGWTTIRTLDRWWGLAAGWAGVALLGAWDVWHWPGYAEGLVELVLIPLAIFALLRTWPMCRTHWLALAAALWIGGMAAALMGLGEWLRGGGTTADGLLRLVGPTFSPNHTALYLERTLFLGVGLGLAAWGSRRVVLLAATGIMALALLLTGSRGALLLGVPAGIATLIALRPTILPAVLRRVRRLPRMAWIGGLLAAAALAWVLAPRLSNRASVDERLAVWTLTLAIWRDHWWTGTGPGGFYWRFPAYLPVDSSLDPNLRHPHMIWLEMAAQGGLAGLAWLLWALAASVHWLWVQRARLTWPQIGLVAGLAAGLAHAQVDAFLTLPDLAAWNWAAIALILACDKR